MSQRRLPVGELLIERDVRHETPDGVELSSNVMRPAFSDEHPVPVILNRTIYDIADDVVARGFYLDDAFVSKALANGYAIVYEHSRGRGKSEGEFNWPANELEDGVSTIEWLAEQPWCNGDVGMWGGSNRGTTQILATAGAPEPLKAIHPIAVPPRRLKYGVLGIHSMIPVAMKNATLSAIRLNQFGDISDELLDRIQDAAMDATERTDDLVSFRPMIDLPDHVFSDIELPPSISPKDLIPFWEMQLSSDGDEEYWSAIDYEQMFDSMQVPALHVTGWFDLCQDGTMACYRGMRNSTSEDQFLLAGPYHHMNIGQTDCMGAIDFGPQASLTGLTFSGFAELEVEFFDIYLKCAEPREGSILADPSNPVRTFRMRKDGGEWITNDDWPPSTASTQTWYISRQGDANKDLEDGHLANQSTEITDSYDTYIHDPNDPVPSRGGALSCRSVDHPPGIHDVSDIQPRDDILTYTTDPLDEATELAGSGTVSLYCETEAEDTDFYARLSHVLEDGSAYNLTEGVQRVQFRGEGYGGTPVEPGEEFQVEINLLDIHYLIPDGDRLRLEIASSSVPLFDAHPGTVSPWEANDDDVRAVEQTVFHDQDRPSSVSFPTVR